MPGYVAAEDEDPLEFGDFAKKFNSVLYAAAMASDGISRDAILICCLWASSQRFDDREKSPGAGRDANPSCSQKDCINVCAHERRTGMGREIESVWKTISPE